MSWLLSPAAGTINLGDLQDINLAGAANNDLLYRSGGDWIDSDGVLTWDGNVLTIKDAGKTDSLAISHDGANLTFDFTNTLDAIFTGAPEYYFENGVNAATNIIIGPRALTGNSADGGMIITSESGGTLYGARLGMASTSMTYQGTTTGPATAPATSVSYSALNLHITGNKTLYIQDGGKLRIQDALDTDYVTQSHDGTDYNFVGTNTAAINMTSGITTVNLPIANATHGNMPSAINTQNGSYTLVLGDAGKTIRKASGGAGETFTIPANASVAYPIGTFLGFDNEGGGDLTIAITTDTLIFADDGTTGSRTLSDSGYAVAQKMEATVWKIAGKQLA